MNTLIIILTAMTLNLSEGKSIYDLSIKNAEGETISLAEFKGKKLMIVNVASECGYTPQYAQLQELHETYGESVVILGVPCNDFGGQEPGTESEILTFCSKNYGVTFTITEKVGIKKDTHPLYQWLTQKDHNGISNNSVRWNFHKFLIDGDGTLYASLPSSVTPLDQEILDWVTK